MTKQAGSALRTFIFGLPLQNKEWFRCAVAQPRSKSSEWAEFCLIFSIFSVQASGAINSWSIFHHKNGLQLWFDVSNCQTKALMKAQCLWSFFLRWEQEKQQTASGRAFPGTPNRTVSLPQQTSRASTIKTEQDRWGMGWWWLLLQKELTVPPLL